MAIVMISTITESIAKSVFLFFIPWIIPETEAITSNIPKVISYHPLVKCLLRSDFNDSNFIYYGLELRQLTLT
jgi:hypothetical protein